MTALQVNPFAGLPGAHAQVQTAAWDADYPLSETDAARVVARMEDCGCAECSDSEARESWRMAAWTAEEIQAFRHYIDCLVAQAGGE